VTSVSTDDDEKLAPGRIVSAVIFALLALAFFGVACAYLITPGFLGSGHSGGHHSLRGVASFVIGLAFAGGSWFALRYRSLALEEAREADRAAALAEAKAEQATVRQVAAGQATAGQATEA
jgi:hypothetical protein